MNTRESITQLPGARFYWHAWRRDLTNLSFRRHRQFDAYIASMHQSGTHWVKYMLSLMIAREAGLRPPAYIGESLVIGGPKDPPLHRVEPNIGISHTIPSPLIGCDWLYRRLQLPRYVLLVRDIRHTLTSHYEKWKGEYQVDFSTYLRGDVRDKRFDKDIWWDIRFMNTWGRFQAQHPERCRILRYEDLRHDPAQQLDWLIDFLNIRLADKQASIDYAVAESRKDKMAKIEDPKESLAVVRTSRISPQTLFGAQDRQFLQAACGRHLKYDFGYRFDDWENI